MNCHYCFYHDEMEKRTTTTFGFMAEETLEQIIVKAFDFADSECTFAYQGGEPALIGLEFYQKAVMLQKKHNTKGLLVNNAFQTNGLTLDDKWCAFFADNNFLVGVSIDGVRQTHDKNRKTNAGEDTYLKCMDGIQALNRWGVEYNILTVVNKDTALKINKIYQTYQKKGFWYQQYIACLDPLFETAGKMPYSLTPEIYGEFLCELFELWKTDLQQNRQPYIRQFENYIGILIGNQPESCEQNGICGFQNVVEADGSVYPCDFYVLDEYKLGNLNHNSFAEINQKREEIGFIKESENHSVTCKQCKYFRICRGGCRRHRVKEENGEGYRNYFCQSYKMLFERHYNTMHQIAKAFRNQPT